MPVCVKQHLTKGSHVCVEKARHGGRQGGLSLPASAHEYQGSLVIWNTGQSVWSCSACHAMPCHSLQLCGPSLYVNNKLSINKGSGALA
eukprot:1158273-Pelagomonas_calceolata.AAC.7